MPARATARCAAPRSNIPSTTTIRVDLIKGWTLEWPRLEREDFIMAIGSARPLEDATRIAYRELVLWMEAEYGFNRWDAYMMLSQCGRVRLGNFVDPEIHRGRRDSEELPCASKDSARCLKRCLMASAADSALGRGGSFRCPLAHDIARLVVAGIHRRIVARALGCKFDHVSIGVAEVDRSR